MGPANPTPAVPEESLAGYLRPMVAGTSRRVLVTDLEGTVLLVSDAAAEFLDIEVPELVGSSLYEPTDDDEPSVPLLISGLLTNGRRHAASRAKLTAPDGTSRDLRLEFTLVEPEGRERACLLVELVDLAGAGPDIAEPTRTVDTRGHTAPSRSSRDDPPPLPLPSRRVAPKRPGPPPISPSEGWTALALDSVADIVLVIQGDDITWTNRTAQRLLGLRELGSTPVDIVLTDESAHRIDQGARPIIAERATWKGVLTFRTNGEERRLQCTITAPDEDEETLVVVAAHGTRGTDGGHLADLTHQATHDSLTGLPNRTLILDRLGDALVRTASSGSRCAVAFFDLDRFKQVNDTLGHEIGDELLRQVAARITAVTRPADLVGRLGGDEFVVICEHVRDEDHALDMVRRMTRSIESRPICHADVEIDVTVSGGIALGSAGVHPEQLLRDADAAMYRSKSRGRARLEVYDDEMRRRADASLQLTDDLAAALESGAITPSFQPVVDLTTGQVIAVEALARWNHPQRGAIVPDDFIPVAEDTGLILQLGLAILHQSCAEAARWREATGRTIPVHVNLAPRQLVHANLPILIRGILESLRLPPEVLCLEITESALIEDASATRTTIEALREMGIRLAIDDFGTGYSSLSYLTRFPVDTLKIDRSFAEGVGSDADDRAIVGAIISLANTLGMRTVAEGIEDQAQLDALAKLGCDAGQGFYLARPMPGDAMLAMLAGDQPMQLESLGNQFTSDQVGS